MEENYIMYVYKTTNLKTGLIYIGQHIQQKKKKYHKKYLGSGKLLKENIKEYGKENFSNEIIEYCNSMKELNEGEIFWIKEYDSTNPEIGYNISAGGSQCLPSERYYERINSEERLEKYRKTRKENYHKHKYGTKENRERISKMYKGENNPNFGNKWTIEQRENMSKYRKENGTSSGENNPNYGKFGKDASGYKEIEKEIYDNVLNDYLNNFLCIRKLSRKYNISEEKVKQIIVENNLEIRVIYFSEENQQKVLDMFLKDRLSINKISKIFNLDKRNISKLLNRLGVDVLKTTEENYENSRKNREEIKIKKVKVEKLKVEKVEKVKEKRKNYTRIGEDNPNYKSIPEDIKNKILYEYSNEFTALKILCKKYNTNPDKTRRFLNDLGIDTKCLYISDEMKQKMINMYTIDDMTITKISKTLKLDVRNIRKVFRENNIEILPTSTKNKRNKKASI